MRNRGRSANNRLHSGGRGGNISSSSKTRTGADETIRLKVRPVDLHAVKVNVELERHLPLAVTVLFHRCRRAEDALDVIRGLHQRTAGTRPPTVDVVHSPRLAFCTVGRRIRWHPAGRRNRCLARLGGLRLHFSQSVIVPPPQAARLIRRTLLELLSAFFAVGVAW